jgi:hypothetical protein
MTYEVGFVLADIYIYFAMGDNTIEHQHRYSIKRVRNVSQIKSDECLRRNFVLHSMPTKLLQSTD